MEGEKKKKRPSKSNEMEETRVVMRCDGLGGGTA